MLNFRVNSQTLTKMQSSTAVGDSINYISASFAFSDEWVGLNKWAHFEQGDKNYIVELHDDKIEATQGLNLSEGVWHVYVHGNKIEGETVTQRITTNVVSIDVKPTGVIGGEPFPPMSPSAEEQILGKAVNALDISNEALTVANDDQNIASQAAISAAQSLQDAIDIVNAFGAHTVEETTKFNNNAEAQTNTFNANVTTQTDAFNDNATSETADFNANAVTKTEDYDGNATSKTDTYNANTVEKTNAYNTNATEKQLAVDTSANNAQQSADTAQQLVDNFSVALDGTTTDYKGVTHGNLNERLMADNSIENLQSGKTYKYGFQVNESGNPQLIYEEIAE